MAHLTVAELTEGVVSPTADDTITEQRARVIPTYRDSSY
jgi:hypothetical protein